MQTTCLWRHKKHKQTLVKRKANARVEASNYYSILSPSAKGYGNGQFYNYLFPAIVYRWKQLLIISKIIIDECEDWGGEEWVMHLCCVCGVWRFIRVSLHQLFQPTNAITRVIYIYICAYLKNRPLITELTKEICPRLLFKRQKKSHILLSTFSILMVGCLFNPTKQPISNNKNINKYPPWMKANWILEFR